MRNSVYNIAILGCGKVAHLHASAIQNLPNARLAGVWSRTQQTANGFACQYKVPAYTDVAELIKKEKLTWLSSVLLTRFIWSRHNKLPCKEPISWWKNHWHRLWKMLTKLFQPVKGGSQAWSSQSTQVV